MELNIVNIVSLVIILICAADIKLMISPKTALLGNRIGALSMLGAIVFVLIYNNIITISLLLVSLIIGAFIGVLFTYKTGGVKIPQLVALFNGFGGGASLLVTFILLLEQGSYIDTFTRFTAFSGAIVGGLTFSGSLIAAGKLEGIINQKPVTIKAHSIITSLLLIILLVIMIFGTVIDNYIVTFASGATVLSLLFGVIFAIRIGGADMPITISLLNSCSGLAASVCGFAVGDIILISLGAIVGASGLILTQIMCKAMNRSLWHILTGSTYRKVTDSSMGTVVDLNSNDAEKEVHNYIEIVNKAKKIVIVPGYGMALSQAQEQVKLLFDYLITKGKDVRFAIHPVAGRMPGHMNVLLAEVDIPYEYLYDIDTINPEFASTDVVIVVGACDVINPEAITAQGTPIYGMPILRVHEAKHVIVCNKDTKPGYSGVENSLYNKSNVTLLLGNAADTLAELISQLHNDLQSDTVLQN